MLNTFTAASSASAVPLVWLAYSAHCAYLLLPLRLAVCAYSSSCSSSQLPACCVWWLVLCTPRLHIARRTWCSLFRAYQSCCPLGACGWFSGHLHGHVARHCLRVLFSADAVLSVLARVFKVREEAHDFHVSGDVRHLLSFLENGELEGNEETELNGVVAGRDGMSDEEGDRIDGVEELAAPDWRVRAGPRKRREEHEATRVPFRDWCARCIWEDAAPITTLQKTKKTRVSRDGPPSPWITTS